MCELWMFRVLCVLCGKSVCQLVWWTVVVVYKGELYILSGYNGIHDLHFDDMYRFNPGKQCWLSICIVAIKCCIC